MNEHFVSVKVDREERPDVDAVYMEAVQAATGQGGWPMTVFLTPGRRAVLLRHLLPARAPARHAVLPAGPRGVRGLGRAAGRGRRGRREDRAATLAGRGARRTAATQAPGEQELAQALLGLTRGVRRRSTAGSAGRRSSRRPWCSSSCCGTTPARGPRARCRWPRTPARRWRAAASTTSSAAASPGTPWTATGWCRTSRRCSTTTRCCAGCTRTCGGRRGARGGPGSGAGPAGRAGDRGLHGRGNCARPRAGSPPRSTRQRHGAARRGRLLRLDARRSCARCSGTRTARWPPGCFGVTEEGTFEEGASVLQLPRRRRRLDAGARSTASRARLLARARARGPRPAGTTRWSPPGTGWRSPRSPRPARTSTGRTSSRPRRAAADLLRTGAPGTAGGCCAPRATGGPGANAGVLEDYADVAEGFLALSA